MRSITLVFLTLIGVSFLFGQSLEDLQKLEALKAQLEKAGEKISPQKLPTAPETKSLEQFKDKLSNPPVGQPVLKDTSKKVETKATNKPPILQKSSAQLKPYGWDVFKQAQIDFKPEMYGPVDENYPIAPGDEIIITVWGEVELRHDLTVDRNGQVYIPNVGIVPLAGLSLKQAKERLIKRMGESYSSLLKDKAFLDVSLGKLRYIRVYVVGDVKSPGVFTVPALTSPLQILFYAGGVKETASLRHIKVVRGDRLFADLDFYEFLKNGKEFSHVRLQTHDVIVVPTAQKRVWVKGAVRIPAIFELKENEGLQDVIRLAGGFLSNAYVENIQIERHLKNKEFKLFSVNFRELREKGKKMALADGDRISVPFMDREIRNFVTIHGPIYGPKKFEYKAGMTIKDLMKKVDSLQGDAYLERVQITRTLPDNRKQLYSINLKEILENPSADFPLAPLDQISIMSTLTLFPPDSVTIVGAVNKPGRYLLKKDMTLKDLIFTAGGFRKDALITKAEISRIYPFHEKQESKLAQIIDVPIDSNYTKDIIVSPDEQFFLKPFDYVFIRSNSDWELQRNVVVQGEVQRPGTYTLQNKYERITDIIKRAGGLKPTAYLDGAKFYRAVNGVGQIGVDFKKIFEDPANPQNIILQSGDRIIIPEKMFTVRVVGGVNFPSSVLFKKGEGVDYYIKAAGGFTDLADKSNITIRLANGMQFQPKRFLFWKYLPEKITAGSTIYVPVLAEKKEIDWSGAIRDAAAIMSSIATTILIYDRFVK